MDQSIGFWAAGQLKKVAVSGGAPVTLADVPVDPAGASWGADDLILYMQREGIMQVAGASGTPALLTPANESEFFYGPQMLPDGEWVLLTLAADQTSCDAAQIVVQSVDADYEERDPALSPDGRWLAYFSDETGSPRIYVRPFPNIDEGQWRVSPDFGANPVWSPDGRELFYRSIDIDDDGDLMVAQIETEPTFSAGTPEPLFSLSGYALPIGRTLALAPDGDRFLFGTSGTPGQAGDHDAFNGLIFVEHWFEALTARVPVP